MHKIDGHPSRPRLIVLWTGLIALVGVMVALFLPPPSPNMDESAAAQPNPPLSQATAGETCLRLSENPSDYLSEDGWRRRTELRLASCKMAFAAEPENTHFKVAVARAMPHAQRAESLALLREAAAQNDAEA
jgi:hypothetical protein